MPLPISPEGLTLGAGPMDSPPLPNMPLAGQASQAPVGGNVPPSGIPLPQPAPQMPQPTMQMAPPVPPAQMPSVQAARAGLATGASQEGSPLRGFFASLAGVDPYANTKALANFDIQQQQLAQQQQQMAIQTMQQGMTMLMKFADMDPEQQKALAPAFAPFVQQSFRSVGMEVPPDLFAALATSPGAAKAAMNVFFQDHAFDNDHEMILASLRKLKGPEVYNYLTKIQNEKVSSTMPQIAQGIPQMVAQYRMALNMPGNAMVPVEPIVKAFNENEAIKNSPTLQRAVYNLFYGEGAAERLKAWGLGNGADVSAERQKWTWEKLVGTGGRAGYVQEDPKIQQTIETLQNTLGREPTPAEVWDATTPADRRTIMAKVNEKVSEEPIKLKKGVELAQPVPFKDLTNLALVSELEKGNVKAPPFGTTVGEANKMAVEVTEKQKEAMRSLRASETLLDTLDARSARLIKATNATDAFKQSLSLWAGATAGTNPEAKAYNDILPALKGPLARGISSERGVLTDFDISRITGALTGFRDTQASRAIKIQTIREILNLNRQALLEEIRGGTMEGLRETYRGQFDDLIKRLALATPVRPGYTKLSRGKDVIEMPNEKVNEAELAKKGWTVHRD